MFRSLHMKLMLIMTLLIILLMTVVGAFLINSVSNYYTQDFYTQMSEAFQDADFWADLNTPVQGEEDSVESIVQILDNYYSVLGVDNRSRKYYVLDGRRAVEEGLIDQLGGLSEAMRWLYRQIES